MISLPTHKHSHILTPFRIVLLVVTMEIQPSLRMYEKYFVACYDYGEWDNISYIGREHSEIVRVGGGWYIFKQTKQK